MQYKYLLFFPTVRIKTEKVPPREKRGFFAGGTLFRP